MYVSMKHIGPPSSAAMQSQLHTHFSCKLVQNNTRTRINSWFNDYWSMSFNML